MIWSQLIANAMVNLLVVGLGSFLIKRAVERRDQEVTTMKDDLRRLKEQRIVQIEDAQREIKEDAQAKLAHAALARKAMHEELAEIRAKFVHKMECKDMHDKTARQYEKFEASSIELARMAQELKTTARFVNEVNDRQIALMQDLARLEGSR